MLGHFKQHPARLSETIALIAVLFGFAVVGIRWQAGIEAAYDLPGTAQTSGCEEESWMALWNKLHGNPVFRDIQESPFNFSYFNWGFYEFYGSILSIGDAKEFPSRIISVGRTISFASGVAGFVFFTIALARVNRPSTTSLGTLLFWSSLPFVSPVTNWFIVTVRPDIAALSFEAAALIVFLILRPRHRIGGLLLAGFCGYCAWSLKTSYVGALCTIGFFLIFRRSWRDLLQFCLPVFVLMGATLLFGGETYREALIGASFGQSPFSASAGIAVLKQFILTGAPLLVGLAVSVTMAVGFKFQTPSRSKKAVNQDAILLGTIGTIFVTLFMGAEAFKQGAWVNYYMPATVPGCILAIALIPRIRRPWLPTLTAASVMIILHTGLLLGAWGKTDLNEARADLNQRWEIYSELPEPRFSRDLRLNLPWLNPNSTPYILAYDYPELRDAGVNFEGNGIGGAISRGEIKSLFLPSTVESTYDHSSLHSFSSMQIDQGWKVFTLKSEPQLSSPFESL